MALADFFTRPSSEAPAEGGLSPDLADRLEQAKAAYQKQYGKPMPITSGFRTKEEQQRLFDQRKNNPNLVAAPGTSLHETGNAVDIGTTVPEAFLNQFGIHRPLGKKDPVHAVLMPSQTPSEGGLASFFTRQEGEQAPKEQDLTKPYIGYRPMRSQAAMQAQQAGSPEMQQASQERGKEGNFLRDLALGGASLADMTVGGVLPMAGQVTQAIARPFTTPQRAEQIGGAVTSALEKPFGKTLGAMGVGQGTESPAYKQEMMRSVMDAFAEKGIEPTAEAIAQKTGMPIEDVRNMLGTTMIGVAPTVGKYAAKGFNVAREVAGDVRSQMQQQLAAKQGQPQAPQAQQVAPSGFQSGGAAAVAHESAIREALARNPELQAKYGNVPPESFTPQDLVAIDTHNKFAKFDMTPTEGQALRDVNKMSEEYNARLKDPELLARIQERDPKLIAGFQKVRETIAPDVFETNPVQLANAPLEKMKADLVNHEQRIRDAYDKANNATGTGESPIDVGELQNNIETALKKKQRTRYLPAELKADLEDALSKNYLTPEEYENFRTDTATIARTHKDPMARQAAIIVRDQLENVTLQGEFAQYKPLFDEARNLTKQLKEKEKIPAYRAAASDTRTPDQIDSGVPHPAANTFLEKHFGEKTSQSDIDKMLNIIGKDSPEHQALMAARLDAIKKNSGIVNDQGIVQQKALNKQVFEQYKGNGNVLFGPEKFKELQDLADVANLSEHVKGRHSVNVSNTEILAEQNRIKDAAKEVAGGLAASKADVAIQSGTGIPMVGTLTRMFLKKKAEQQAAEQALAAERALSAKRTSPTAGISISPPPVKLDLRGMANKE
jgi:hypothetical protein